LSPSIFSTHEQYVIQRTALWLLSEEEKRLRMLLNETADIKLLAKTHLLNADSFLKKEIDAYETRLLEIEQKDEDLRRQLDEATQALHEARHDAQMNVDSKYSPRHHERNIDVPGSPGFAEKVCPSSSHQLTYIHPFSPYPSPLLYTAVFTNGQRGSPSSDLGQTREHHPPQRSTPYLPS
jgi:hypothetical protein